MTENDETSAVSENNDAVALLLGKAKTTTEWTFYAGTREEPVEIAMAAAALSMKDYDKLLAKYPPTEEERQKGLNYELEKFAPALIAASLSKPSLSLAQAKQIWTGENWSRGDVEGIFSKVLQVNHQDSTVPFTVRG